MSQVDSSVFPKSESSLPKAAMNGLTHCEDKVKIKCFQHVKPPPDNWHELCSTQIRS